MQDLVAEGMICRVPGRGTFPVPRDGRYLRQFGSVKDLMGLSLDTHGRPGPRPGSTPMRQGASTRSPTSSCP